MVTNRNISILLIVMFTIAAVLRFISVVRLGYFMLDEERDAFLVRRMLVDRRPLLVGGSIPGGINVGPGFFYISAIPYYLSRLNPVGPAWAAAVIGIIGVVGVFFVGKEMFGRRVGLLAAVLAGFSLLNVVYQRPWWPLTMSQAAALAVYLSLFKLTGKLSNSDVSKHWSKRSWLLILTGFLTLGAQSDPSTLSLIPLSIVWLWWHRRLTGLTRRNYLTAAAIFLLAHTSWFIFELRHDFQSTRAILGLFTGVSFPFGKETPDLNFWSGPGTVLKMTAATVYRLFIPTGPLDVTKQISPAEVFLNQRLSAIWWPLAWIMLILIVLYAIFYSRKTDAIASGFCESRAIISWHFLISLGGILVYTILFPGYVHEWMWFFMFPGFFLIATDILVSLERRWKFAKPHKMRSFANFSMFAVIGGWVIWQVSLFLKLENVAGLGAKLRVVQAAQAEIAGRPYELRSEGEGGMRYGGWRYLFTLYGDPPVKSYMDYVYEKWLYQKSEYNPQVILTVVNSVDQVPHFTLGEP